MKTQVLYKSRTGNTEKLAKAIFAAVPGSDKDIARLDGQTDYDMADIYFIGFWTDRGSASVEVLDYLGSLQGKNCSAPAEWEKARSILRRLRRTSGFS